MKAAFAVTNFSGSRNSNVFATNPRALIVTIEGLLSSLSPANRAIADVLLKLQRADPSMVRMAHIAEAAQVSEAAVVKFAQQLGLSGFRELRSIFLRYQEMEAVEEYEELSVEDGSEALIRKIFNTSIRSLKDTLAVFDFAAFEQAAEALAQARQRVILGLGGSAPLAREFEHRLLDVGLTSQAYDEPQLLTRAVALVNARDVVVAISHSGSTEAILDAAKTARDRGATTIGLTNMRGSALTSICSYSLISAARGSEVVGVKTMSKVAHLNILYGLAVRAAHYALTTADDVNAPD